MSQVILITSPRYSGKTTATANIGVGLIRTGKKVLLIDMDNEFEKTRPNHRFLKNPLLR
jgi:septum formation inhibitor-activating ATPase MinD